MASCHLAVRSLSCQLASNFWSRTSSKASLCMLAFEEVCPLSGQKHWQSSLCGIFISLTRPRQDLVDKFSRGNASNKNLMGSGSSAESPCEFQVPLWSLAWTERSFSQL